MTSQPETAPGEPRKLKVRRAPKYVPFLIAGAVAGGATDMLPPTEGFETSSVFGLFTVLLILPGAGLGAIVALVLDHRGRRRTKTLIAEALPDDERNAAAETA